MDPSMAPCDSGEHYSRLRLKLTMYFERRRCTDAAGLADECIGRLVEACAKRGAPDSLDAFAFGIARNLSFEWARQSSRVGDGVIEDEPAAAISPIAERARTDAREVVEQLASADRELLEEYFLDGATAVTLGKRIGVSAVAVRIRIHRLRKRLREYVIGKGGGMKRSGPPDTHKGEET
jgi:RNA polymerase sigma-70 factor (ECF subfamily)